MILIMSICSTMIWDFLSQDDPERDKVRHCGIGDESRSRAVYAKLESNSEPERARVCQRVAVRASESQSGSYREP